MSKCIVCEREDFSPSMGGNAICSWCDCGGLIEFGGIKYIRVDMLNAYRHILDKIPKENNDIPAMLKELCEKVKREA